MEARNPALFSSYESLIIDVCIADQEIVFEGHRRTRLPTEDRIWKCQPDYKLQEVANQRKLILVL